MVQLGMEQGWWLIEIRPKRSNKAWSKEGWLMDQGAKEGWLI